MSSGGEYTVSATPQQHLVYTNHVYLGDDASNARVLTKRPGQPDTYVLVNGCFIYVARAHKSVGPGEIGLSSIQRETLRVSTAQQTTVAPWSLPVNGSADLVTLRLEVELIGTKKATVAGAELSPVLVKQFVGQVFTRGQVFCTDFQGTALKFTVVHGEAGVPVEEQDKKLKHAQEHKGESDEEVRGDGQAIELHSRGRSCIPVSGPLDEFASHSFTPPSLLFCVQEDDEGTITREVDRGVINSETRIEIVAVPSKFLTFKAEEKKNAGMLNPKFRFADMGIGGLDAEFGMIFRRSFASRLFPPEVTKKLGIRHVKGMLLYGPPGTGRCWNKIHGACS